MQNYTVEVPQGADRLEAVIGNPTDLGADLDLTVYLDGVVVGQSADGDSEESVSIEDPAAGTYTVELFGYDVPAGTTEFDYRDVFYAGSLGSVEVDGTPVQLDNGETAELTGSVTAGALPADGRRLFGEMTLNSDGAVIGRGGVLITEVLPAGR
jgi:hypothetical protein